jgi:hypothetical protein
MACPTSELKAFSLPARYSSTDFWLAASTSSTSASMAPVSVICFQAHPPRLLHQLSVPSPAHNSIENAFLAPAFEMVASVMRVINSASFSAGIRMTSRPSILCRDY